MSNKKIVISDNGPYLVYGGIPLEELIIEETEKGNIYKQGRKFPVKDFYALCRCGKSKNKPFCDGMHAKTNFNGRLYPLKDAILDNVKIYNGKNFVLKDIEPICAFARFCHSNYGDIWTVTETASTKETEMSAIKMACDCPSGRLIMIDKKTNQEIEPTFEPSIILLQDPSRNCSGPIWVRGNIPIEDDKGYTYKLRNRVTLCRCGASTIKPFCDAMHISVNFNDKN